MSKKNQACRNHGSTWTLDELRFLERSYHRLPTKAIADILGRTSTGTAEKGAEALTHHLLTACTDPRFRKAGDGCLIVKIELSDSSSMDITFLQPFISLVSRSVIVYK